jgi:hypothetical protein
MWPPDPPEPVEAELTCEGWCLEEGLEIIFFAYGDLEPDEDGTIFIAGEGEGVCPWCGGTEHDARIT